MRRVTKADLKQMLDESVAFQKMRTCGLYLAQGIAFRERAGFIPAEKYPYWCVPRKNEFGMLGSTRYLFVDDR